MDLHFSSEIREYIVEVYEQESIGGGCCTQRYEVKAYTAADAVIQVETRLRHRKGDPYYKGAENVYPAESPK